MIRPVSNKVADTQQLDILIYFDLQLFIGFTI